MTEFQKLIRIIPDYPEQGISFKDITPLLSNPKAYGEIIDLLADFAIQTNANKIAGIESRGFFFSCPLATKLNLPFIPIRKKGKLPYETIEISYQLEYGNATIEIHKDAVNQNDRVLIIDDVLATGGTALAAGNLIKQLNAEIAGYGFLINLTSLNEPNKFEENIFSIINY